MSWSSSAALRISRRRLNTRVQNASKHGFIAEHRSVMQNSVRCIRRPCEPSTTIGTPQGVQVLRFRADLGLSTNLWGFWQLFHIPSFSALFNVSWINTAHVGGFSGFTDIRK